MPTYAIVTGASSGIGLQVARLLAARGYGLVLVARRKERLEALRDELARPERPVRVLVEDLGTRDASARIEAATADLDVEILVNNAGYGMQGRMLDMDLAAVEAMSSVNVHALTELTTRFARRMVTRGGGYILNVASAAAFLPSPYVAAYAATKAYVLHFSEALAYELQGTGVSVTTLYPGITPTEFNEVAGARTPGWLAVSILGADRVADIGVRAMFARRRAVVPGWINWMNAIFSHLLPRGFIVWVTGRTLGAANGWTRPSPARVETVELNAPR